MGTVGCMMKGEQMANITFPIQVNLPDDWVDQIIDRLLNDPDADWVEVTRCKDCKHRLSSLYCEAWNNSPGFPCIGDEMFCSMAERRTDER